MKHTPRVNRSSLNGGSADNRTITISFIGSVLIHGILMALLFVGFDHTPRISMAPSAINVTMISTQDLPPPPPPPAMKVKTANLSPKSSEQAEAPAVIEEEPPAGEPDGQEEEAPAVEKPEPATPEPPAEEPETAAPEPTPPPEPEVKKASLKKPAELPEPIPPPTAKEQVVLKEKVVIEDAPKEAEKVQPKPEKPVKKTKPAEEKPKADQVASGDAEATPQAKAAVEPKLIKSSAKNRKAGNDQKSVITPSAARQESIKDAIDKVKAKAKRGAGGQGTGSTVAANTGGAAGGAAGQSGGVAGGVTGGLIGGTGKGGGISGSISDIYKAQISYQIERNWAFSANLAGDRKDLRTILVITILPSGEIQNPRYEQRSGNSFLDQSAFNAVMKSNPLPPLPRGLSEYTIALVFTPTGLN